MCTRLWMDVHYYLGNFLVALLALVVAVTVLFTRIDKPVFFSFQQFVFLKQVHLYIATSTPFQLTCSAFITVSIALDRSSSHCKMLMPNSTNPGVEKNWTKSCFLRKKRWSIFPTAAASFMSASRRNIQDELKCRQMSLLLSSVINTNLSRNLSITLLIYVFWYSSLRM